MKARIKYFGGEQNDIFDDAFLLPDGVDLDILEATGTKIRVRNPDTGAVTIITGTGFTYGPDGTPTGGTVEAATFKQGGSVVARFTKLAWPMADVVTAVDELNSGVGDGFTPLLNRQPIVADATKATNGFIITDDGTSELTRPVTILGSDFNDVLVGSRKSDRIEMGESEGYDVLFGSKGNDTIDYARSLVNYQELSYNPLARRVEVTIDGSANTASVVKAGGTWGADTILDIANPLASGWTTGGIGFYGTAKGDRFTIDGGAETWMQVGGGAGKDVFDITLSGWVRLNYGWDGGAGPVQGVNIDIGKGKAFNDGFGSRDLINITDGAGRLQLRGTGFDDVMKGSARREDFITDAGNDTVNGRGGDDRIRYDRGGYEAVTVKLGAGTADVTINGTVWTDTLIKIEDARGTWGDDLIIGSKGGNVLQGRGGNDTIKGLAGRDEIWGEGDDDVLTGGGAADVFHYAVGVDEGFDRIADFQDGVDLIGYLGGSFADVTAQSAGGGANTRLVFVDGTEVLLKGVASTDIDASDFLF